MKMPTEEAVHYREWMETMKKNEIGTSSTEYIFELKKQSLSLHQHIQFRTRARLHEELWIYLNFALQKK